jgi:hypothetical protein
MKNSPSSYSSSSDGGRVLKIFLWIFGGIIGLGLFCCLCTLVTLWFTGDYFVEFFKTMIR